MNIITFITITWFHYYYIRRAWSRQEIFGKRALSARLNRNAQRISFNFNYIRSTEYGPEPAAYNILRTFIHFYKAWILRIVLSPWCCSAATLIAPTNRIKYEAVPAIYHDLKISFLEGLPVEWQVSIARCSPLSAAASFASSSNSVVGRQYWYHDGPNRLNMKCFSVSWKKKRIATGFAINAQYIIWSPNFRHLKIPNRL